jgi:hypothetical protein
VRVGPALADKRAVPSEDCLRRDEERSPALTGYESGQEGDEGTVGPGEAGTGDLAAEHGELVAQDKDLCILCRGIRPVDANDLEHALEETVEEGQGHDGSLTEGVLAGQIRSEGFWTLRTT